MRIRRRGEKIILSIVRELAIDKKRATLSDPEKIRVKIKQDKKLKNNRCFFCNSIIDNSRIEDLNKFFMSFFDEDSK